MFYYGYVYLILFRFSLLFLLIRLYWDSFFLNFVFSIYYFISVSFIVFHVLCFITFQFLSFYMSTLCWFSYCTPGFQRIISTIRRCDCTMSDRSRRSSFVQSHVCDNHWTPAAGGRWATTRGVFTTARHWLGRPRVVHWPIKCGWRDRRRRSLIRRMAPNAHVL